RSTVRIPPGDGSGGHDMTHRKSAGTPPTGGGSGRGRTVGIVVGAVVAVAAVVGGAVLFTGGGPAEDDGPHKLTTPQKVAEEFDRQGAGKDDSDLPAGEKDSLQALPGVTDPHPVQAEYQTASKKQMLLTGVWGEVENPEQVIDAMFVVIQKSAEEQGDVEVLGSPESVEPDGLGSAVMKCQKFKTTVDDPDVPIDHAELPVCIWADSSTVGGVMVMDPVALIAGKADVEGVAETAAEVRADARVKIGK
ncbi:hypothetical protein, partial [Streptomyces sp. NPDC048845]|uniref:hypothetical protein n=1 Tax=Streptomyces sp. NPDC048845 TaxID=3155390 RepID=UPI003414F1C0